MFFSALGMGSAYLPLYFFIHASVYLSLIFSPTNAISRNESDRLALLEFKAKITDDPFGVMSSWNTTIHFCRWHGVTCGRRHQRVRVLELNSSKLAGSISPHIGNLSFLRTLRLHNNSLSGEIPPEVGRLRRLQSIILANNSFSGEIPATMSRCSDLIIIQLANNKLVGKVPREFASFSRLQYFVVQGNNLIGSIPPFIGNWSSLLVLGTCYNSFSGSIPEALGRLTNLQRFDVCHNNLSGTIPPSLYNISSITRFYVFDNQIQGTLPSDLGITLPNLQVFSFGFNRFTGVISVSISNATNLFEFYAYGNMLTGKVPELEKLHKLQRLNLGVNHLGTGEEDLSFLISSLANATSLKWLILEENNFQGLLPESTGNLSTTLEIMALNSNQLFGPIPMGIQYLMNLEVLYLPHNKFSGVLPTAIGMLENLNLFSVESNKFSGYIPSFLGNLSLLTELSLGDNHFQGHIPSSIGKCQNLLLLDLSYNNLTGTIPKEVIGLSSLSLYLDLSYNHLIGSLPNEVGNLINLGELEVAHNNLSGEIPRSIGSCIRLEILMMQENFFQGAIPSSLSSLRGIKVLDFSHNNLTGQVPEFLKDFHLLEYLNLSFNDLEGIVLDEGVFKNASATSVFGNNKLCGGIPEFHLPRCIIKESNKRRFTVTVKVIIIISGILSMTSVLSFLYLWLARRKKVPSASTLSFLGNVQMSYQSLLRATNGFSSTNLIGMGSFGSVYKGILDQDGTIIAVKVLNLLQQGAFKSFWAECEALRNIRHRNLVRIVTICSSVDYHGNDFKALVYEFMANGSLEEWLHPSHTGGEAHEAPKALNFLQRVSIATDVACALDYLHHQCETPIVHCDLKPSNVLLDQDMTGHVGDFGLARFLLQSNQVTSQTSSIEVRGTIGYAAPEYGMGSEVSTRGDVYSYGILLLELFTGKRPVDDMFKEGLNLHNFVRIALPERVVEIVDPFLRQEIAHREMNRGHKVQECLISIFEIGVACSVGFPQERMNMSDVVAMLQSIIRKIR